MKLAHEWFGALRSLPSIAPRLLFRKRTLEEELQEVRQLVVCGSGCAAAVAPPHLGCMHASGAVFPLLQMHQRKFEQAAGRHTCQHLQSPLVAAAPAQAMLRGSLRKTFGGFDVLCLGLGILIGSGWAQFTGTAGVYAG